MKRIVISMAAMAVAASSLVSRPMATSARGHRRDWMITCSDTKYHHWFWRPYQAIPAAGQDHNDAPSPTRPGRH